MSRGTLALMFLLAISLLEICAEASATDENGVKSKVYLSPVITQRPGSVSNKMYYDIEFPKGHIAIKSFDAEVVDESGNPVSLQETYLHHWVAVRYYQRKGTKEAKYNSNIGFHQSDLIVAGNAGICKYGLPQIFGLGSETRKTSTHVPDPYGIEVGNPSEVPVGYEERWAFNIHAIDTRGAVDAMGCTECRCNLYNVTEDGHGRPLKPNYVGGLNCCYDGTQCKVKNGLESVERNLYMKYTVKWVDWSDSIVPVKIFIFDVTYTWQKTGTHDCLIEFDVERSTTGLDKNDWISTRRSSVSFPSSGDVIYGVAHQHSGGIGSALYGEDGLVICSSKPIYGQGNTAGDEAGYIVGMNTCYPEPGSVKIAKGEMLTLESNYSSEKSHTGVMGLFYILVAESSSTLNASLQIHQESKVPIISLGVAVFGLAMCAAVMTAYQRRKQSENGNCSIESSSTSDADATTAVYGPLGLWRPITEAKMRYNTSTRRFEFVFLASDGGRRRTCSYRRGCCFTWNAPTKQSHPHFLTGPSELRRHYISRPRACGFHLDGFYCHKGLSCTYQHALTVEEEAHRNMWMRYLH